MAFGRMVIAIMMKWIIIIIVLIMITCYDNSNDPVFVCMCVYESVFVHMYVCDCDCANATNIFKSDHDSTRTIKTFWIPKIFLLLFVVFKLSALFWLRETLRKFSISKDWRVLLKELYRQLKKNRSLSFLAFSCLISLSLSKSIYLSDYISLCLPVYLLSVCQFVSLDFYLFVIHAYLSVCISTCMSNYLSVYLSVHISIFLHPS